MGEKNLGYQQGGRGVTLSDVNHKYYYIELTSQSDDFTNENILTFHDDENPILTSDPSYFYRSTVSSHNIMIGTSDIEYSTFSSTSMLVVSFKASTANIIT